MDALEAKETLLWMKDWLIDKLSRMNLIQFIVPLPPYFGDYCLNLCYKFIMGFDNVTIDFVVYYLMTVVMRESKGLTPLHILETTLRVPIIRYAFRDFAIKFPYCYIEDMDFSNHCCPDIIKDCVKPMMQLEIEGTEAFKQGLKNYIIANIYYLFNLCRTKNIFYNKFLKSVNFAIKDVVSQANALPVKTFNHLLHFVANHDDRSNIAIYGYNLEEKMMQ